MGRAMNNRGGNSVWSVMSIASGDTTPACSKHKTFKSQKDDVCVLLVQNGNKRLLLHKVCS